MRRAFTLVEMLLVVALIALLISMLLPQLNRARESARRAQCANNLHQSHLGFVNYSFDNRTFYPDSKRDDGGQHTGYLSTPIYNALLKAVGDNNLIFLCPNQKPSFQGYLLAGSTPPNGLGYRPGYIYLGGFNFTGWLNLAPNPIWDSPRRSNNAKPNMKLATDYIYQPGPGVNNPTVGSHGSSGEVRSPAGAGVHPSQIGVEGGNTLLVDGAVRWNILKDIKAHAALPSGMASNFH